VKDMNWIKCSVCGGLGIHREENNIECVYCGSLGCKWDSKKGKIITCEDCKGDGYVTGIIHNYCRFCKGEGKRYWTDVIMRPILGR